jgi:hypothetical protein
VEELQNQLQGTASLSEQQNYELSAAKKQLEERTTQVEEAQNQLQKTLSSYEQQSAELKVGREKLRKTNAIAMAHKRSYDKAKQDLDVSSSSLRSTIDENKTLHSEKMSQMQYEHSEYVQRLRLKMEEQLNGHREQWKDGNEATQESNDAKTKSLIADAIDKVQNENATKLQQIMLEQAAKMEQIRMENKANRDSAVQAAIRDVEKTNQVAAQQLMLEDQGRQKQRELERKEERKEMNRLEALLSERNNRLEKRASVQSTAWNGGDLESGAEMAILNITAEDENESLLSGMPTPSKSKELRPKPLKELVRMALLGLPKRARTIVIGYIFALHVVLLVHIIFF